MAIVRNVLLNPGPATTTDTVKAAQVVPDICPREKEFAALMKDLRRALVDIVHGDGRYTSVLFCGSGTINIDACLSSLLPADAKVLVVDNGAYSSRAADVCRAYGLPHVDLKLPVEHAADVAAVEAALAADPSIALVYACHHETGTGVLNPIREIGAAAHARGCVFVVDTTSTYAMRPIDVVRDNVDFLMASAQKGLQAMTGLSFVVGREDLLRASAAYPVRNYYCNLFMQYDGFEKTGEMRFTPPVQTIYATIQAIKEYRAEGEEAKWARHLRVFDALHAGLASLGFRDLIRREEQAGLVVSVRYPDDPAWSFEAVHDYCYARGFTIYPGKVGTARTFRLCALGAIDAPDIEAFFSVFRDALRATGVAVPVRYGKEA
jgi:2-aminoethylphosphonate-pyruvate transaminase